MERKSCVVTELPRLKWWSTAPAAEEMKGLESRTASREPAEHSVEEVRWRGRKKNGYAAGNILGQPIHRIGASDQARPAETHFRQQSHALLIKSR